MTNTLAIVLHGHLPFVRHPEHPQFYEETWLFEAISECYLPLTERMLSWERDGVPWGLTLTATPTLCAMLGDSLLRSRFAAWMESRIRLCELEEVRWTLDPEGGRLAQFYRDWYVERLRTWEALSGDIVGEWRRLQNTGSLEVLTCGATHALLPLLTDVPGLIDGQLATAVREYRHWFGRDPRGIWLPECAYSPGIEAGLLRAGLRRFVLETHGLMEAQPPAGAAVFAPVMTPGGLLAFGRDPASARQVWSRHGGYPGDPRYREFHKDMAHEAEWEYLRPHLPGTENRVFTGLKYHRVTGPGQDKEWYEPEAAQRAVKEHAAHFVRDRVRQLKAAAVHLRHSPMIVAPYDAELFGHWWFEGPDFLDAVVRTIGADEGRGSGVQLATLGAAGGESIEWQRCQPATSSWGEGGHLGVWLSEENLWMQRPLRRAEMRWMEAVRREDFGSDAWRDPEGSVRARLMRQAVRELLLAEGSDWPFLVRMGTATDYAKRRFEGHVRGFHGLMDGLEVVDDGGKVRRLLEELEARNNLFPGVDPKDWCLGS